MSDTRMNDLNDDWKLDGSALTRAWAFDDFAHALRTVNSIGDISEAQNHHPDIEFGWGYVRLRLTTHDVRGVTELDFSLAKAIDAAL